MVRARLGGVQCEAGGRLEVRVLAGDVVAALRVVKVVKGIELHGDEVLGRHALQLLPGVAAVARAQHAPVVANDDGMVTVATGGVGHLDDDHLCV